MTAEPSVWVSFYDHAHVLHLWDSHLPGREDPPCTIPQAISLDEADYPLRCAQLAKVTSTYPGQPAGVLVATLRVPADAVQVLAVPDDDSLAGPAGAEGMRWRVLVGDHDVLVPAHRDAAGELGCVRWYDEHGTRVAGPIGALNAEVDLFFAEIRMHRGRGPRPRRRLLYP